MVRAINCDNLYIDESFSNIEELKVKIHIKYAIPVRIQHIIFNGRFYVLGIFEHLSAEQPSDLNSPFSELGCPYNLYKSLEDSGMGVHEIRKHLFPHEDDADEEKSAGLSVMLDVPGIADEISSSSYGDVTQVYSKFSTELKIRILRSPEEYVDLILTEFSRCH